MIQTESKTRVKAEKVHLNKRSSV